MDNHVFNPPASIPTAENTEPSLTTQAVVSVRNLQLPSGAIAPNIWLERREQPALASVSLWLRNSFTSAASQDALDDSTVHYGELSKRVRAGCTGEEGQRLALEAVLQAAEHMARKPKPDAESRDRRGGERSASGGGRRWGGGGGSCRDGGVRSGHRRRSSSRERGGECVLALDFRREAVRLWQGTWRRARRGGGCGVDDQTGLGRGFSVGQVGLGGLSVLWSFV